RAPRRVPPDSTAPAQDGDHRFPRHGGGICTRRSRRRAGRRRARRLRSRRGRGAVFGSAGAPDARRHSGGSTMRAVFAFLASHRGELAMLLSQHVLLVALATIVAVAIGVPLGVAAARRPRISAPIIAAANIVQTVPSLAMFGFLLPVPLIGGVGARAAGFVL